MISYTAGKLYSSLGLAAALCALLSASPAAAESGEARPRAYAYGTRDIPEGVPAVHYDARFSPPVASKDISQEEFLALDPRDFPQMVLAEEDWKLYLPHDRVETPVRKIIADAKQGNPFAAVWLACKLGKYAYSVDSGHILHKTYMLWMRVADSLAGPGWGEGIKSLNSDIYRLYPSTGTDYALAAIRGHSQQSKAAHPSDYRKGSLLNDPMSLFMEDARFRAGTRGYAAMLSKTGLALLADQDMEKARVWSQEACMRGDADGCMRLGVYYEGGLREDGPKDLYKSYAAYNLGAFVARDERHNAVYVRIVTAAASSILKGLATPEQRAEAEAARAAMLREYEEYRGKVLAVQRARRAAVLPEILRQIGDWEKEARRQGIWW
jgi:TPR repeat protein